MVRRRAPATERISPINKMFLCFLSGVLKKEFMVISLRHVAWEIYSGLEATIMIELLKKLGKNVENR